MARRVGKLSVGEGGPREALGCLNRHERGGEEAPGKHGHQWPCSLDVIQEGKGLRRGKRSD
jgi:hypothetical protein